MQIWILFSSLVIIKIEIPERTRNNNKFENIAPILLEIKKSNPKNLQKDPDLLYI